MTIFSLEDRSGQIDCVMFNRAYERFYDLLKDGAALVIDGKTEIENAGEDDEKIKFIASKAKTINPKPSSYMMRVRSYSSFHLDAEDMFRESYEDKNGHVLLLFDEAMNEIRELNFKVSEKILAFPNVKEI